MDYRVLQVLKDQHPDRLLIFKERNRGYNSNDNKSPKFYYSCYKDDAVILHSIIGYKLKNTKCSNISVKRCGGTDYRKISSMLCSHNQSYMLIYQGDIVFEWDSPIHACLTDNAYKYLRVEGELQNFSNLFNLLADCHINYSVLIGGAITDKQSEYDTLIHITEKKAASIPCDSNITPEYSINSKSIETDLNTIDKISVKEKGPINDAKELNPLDDEEEKILATKNIVDADVTSEFETEKTESTALRDDELTALEYRYLIWDYKNSRRKPSCDNCQLRYNEKCTTLRADATKCDDYIYRPNIDSNFRHDLYPNRDGFYFRSLKEFGYNSQGDYVDDNNDDF